MLKKQKPMEREKRKRKISAQKKIEDRSCTKFYLQTENSIKFISATMHKNHTLLYQQWHIHYQTDVMEEGVGGGEGRERRIPLKSLFATDPQILILPAV